MNLMQLKPRESSFFLEAAKREFKMNPISLADEVWLDRTYGSEKIQQIFTDVNITEISRIVYRLISIEDKMFFKPRTVSFIDEDGTEYEEELGGVDLLRTLVIGNEEKLSLVAALLDNLGISRPEVEETTSTKKKVIRKKKKKK